MIECPEASMYKTDKEEGWNFQKRRSEQWTENYTLYRDTVIYNRLTQRQSVHVPLMKMSLKTLLAQYDDMPLVVFEELGNDKEKEAFLNGYWEVTGNENKFVIQDLVDKKQEEFFGRTYDQWQVIDGKIKQTITPTEDILVSRYVNPIDIHSSRYLIHLNIFVPLSVLEQNEDYDKEAIARLAEWFTTEQGLEQAKENQEQYMSKQQKMSDLGLTDAFDPIIGETMVEIALYFKWGVNREGKGQEIYLTVLAQGTEKLMSKALEEVIGETEDHFWRYHYPYNSWAGDIDIMDWYTDGVADVVRGSNKIIDTYHSQKVENRVMRGFGMHYYNGAIDGAETWAPQTFEPQSFGWYKVPGNPNDIIKKVDIPELGDVEGDIKFIMDINERATAGTSSLQGVQGGRQITLGEVKIDLVEAKERIKGMSIFYNQVWHERALMFLKLIEAAHDRLDAVKIYKKGRNTDNLFERTIEPKDWMSESGYRVRIWSQSEKSTKDAQDLEKLNALRGSMPNNPKVQEIYNRRLAEWAQLTPDEIKEIMDFEDQQREAIQAAAQAAAMGMGGGVNTPSSAPPPQLPINPAPTQMEGGPLG